VTSPAFGEDKSFDFGYIVIGGSLRITLDVTPPSSTRNLGFTFTNNVDESLTPFFLDGNLGDGDTVLDTKLFEGILLDTFNVTIQLPQNGYSVSAITCSTTETGPASSRPSLNVVTIDLDEEDEFIDCTFSVTCSVCAP